MTKSTYFAVTSQSISPCQELTSIPSATMVLLVANPELGMEAVTELSTVRRRIPVIKQIIVILLMARSLSIIRSFRLHFPEQTH
jgi:hypothetical protein